MGDTLRAPKSRLNGASAQIPPLMESSLQSSNLPRKFDQFAKSSTAELPKDSSSIHDTSYLSPPVGPHALRSRQDSTLFLFNPGRQDLISTLLNSYPLAGTGFSGPPGSSRGSNFPSYYMGPRESVSGPSQPTEVGGRLRGDSIFLPPPMTTSKFGEEANAQAVSNGTLGANPSRSNSIFSALIQMPGSSNNSLSGSSMKEPGARRSTLSNPDYLQALDALSKDPNFGWGRDKSISGPKRGAKMSEGYNAFWELMNTPGSIAGINNDNLNAFLASLQHNGSIDFTNMSNQQRRDSILKFINDQGQRRPGSTQLREDIFDKLKMLYPIQDAQERGGEQGHLSPTSSMSSKTSNKIQEPQSPKTSPRRVNSDMIVAGAGTVQQPQYAHHLPQKQAPAFYQDVPSNDPYGYGFQDSMGQYMPQQMHVQSPQLKMKGLFLQYQPGGQQRVPNNSYPIPPHASNSYSPLFKSTQFSGPESPDNVSLYGSRGRPAGQGYDQAAEVKSLVPAQQYAQSEDGRPLLGATKVDQLMLVIQAREKGKTGTIEQAPDGSILAPPAGPDKDSILPQTVELVGGVDKPQRDVDGLDEKSADKRKKRRGKTQQCPYCFKIFNQSTHLDVHVRSHIGYKPFQCKYCFKRFTQGGNLRTHMRLHTGEKPFNCEVCNRSFSRKGNLAAHMLTHNKEKPFECRLDNCDKSFTQLGNLKSHQNKFHLPTLTNLTHTFANLSGDAIEALPDDERDLLDYFAKLYKNSNKGIRGRGKGKRVARINDTGSDQSISATTSAHTSPQHTTLQMQPPLLDHLGNVEQMLPPELNPGAHSNYNSGASNY